MAGDIQRRVRVVMEVDGVEAATDQQREMAQACDEAGRALSDQAREVAGLETRWETANNAFRQAAQGTQENVQAQMLLHQQVQALAGGLAGLSSIIGTNTEAGALVGRMGQMASVGLQLGSIFGPQGAIVGGIAGAVVPAFEAMIDAIAAAEEREHALTVTVDSQASAYGDLLENIRAVNRERSQASILSMGLGSIEEQQAAVDVQQGTLEQLQRTAQILLGQTGTEQNLRALQAVDEARRLTEQRLASAQEALALAQGDADADAGDFIGGTGQYGSDRPARRRGGGRRRAEEDPIYALARGRGQDDALAFSLGLEGIDDRPSDFEIELAGRRRPGGPGSGLRGAAETNAQMQAAQRLADKQKEFHDEEMERIQERVDAWTSAGQQIGSSLYNAFTLAVSGQEQADVAFVKSFKNLAVQFGGQMVNEGIAALLTAAGNIVANPPVAASKAAEGAGKLALGVGLGAAGAAIPVPGASGSQQAPVPRLGPGANDGSYGGGSVVVNMNAPSVVTGTRMELGREMGRAISDTNRRLGRAA